MHPHIGASDTMDQYGRQACADESIAQLTSGQAFPPSGAYSPSPRQMYLADAAAPALSRWPRVPLGASRLTKRFLQVRHP